MALKKTKYWLGKIIRTFFIVYILTMLTLVGATKAHKNHQSQQRVSSP